MSDVVTRLQGILGLGVTPTRLIPTALVRDAINELAEWEQENAPGGWIDGLRKQNDAARDALVQIQICSTDPKIQALTEAGLNPCASDEPATHERSEQP